MIKYLIPVLILSVIIVGLIKKVNVYNCFTKGSREGISLVISIAPYIISIMILSKLFEASGASKLIEKCLAPLCNLLGIPPELIGLIIIRPLSGNGSIAMLSDIITRYGVDSYIARVAAIIVGASETIFYISVVYFATTKVKKLRYGIPVALFASTIGVIASCLLARIM